MNQFKNEDFEPNEIKFNVTDEAICPVCDEPIADCICNLED